MRNPNYYYNQIDHAIRQYEEGKYAEHPIGWITDRIAWCSKFKHITDEQQYELVDRVIMIMKVAEFYK